MNYFINQPSRITEKNQVLKPRLNVKKEFVSNEKPNNMIRDTLLALAMLGMTTVPVSCTKNSTNEAFEEEIEEVTRSKTINPSAVEDVYEYLEDLGFCLVDGGMKQVKTVKLMDTDNDGTITYARKVSHTKNAAIYLCKDVLANGKVVDYTTEFKKSESGLEIYQTIPGIGTGCVVLTPEAEGSYTVCKRKYHTNGDGYISSTTDVPFGDLEVSKEDHEMYYTGGLMNPKSRMIKTVENNTADDVDWNWDLIVHSEGDLDVEITDVDAENLDPYNQ